jgi:hypothetical protein
MLISNLAAPVLILAVLLYGAIKKVDIFSVFTEGAMEYNSSAPWDCIAPILLNSLISLAFGAAAVYILFGKRSRIYP